MKILHEVRPIEVKRAFVIAQKMRPARRLSREGFLKKLHSTKTAIRALTGKRLDTIIADVYGNRGRADAYDNTRWFRANVSTDEVGVWRRARGLPPGWTCCSLKRTAAFVKAALERNSKRIRTRPKKTILSIMEFADIINKETHLFPIVFMSGTGTCGRRWCKNKVRGDIDDGCARSIALAIAGRDTLNVYFGKPK